MRPLVCSIHQDLPADVQVCDCYRAAIAEDIRTTWSKIDAPIDACTCRDHEPEVYSPNPTCPMHA